MEPRIQWFDAVEYRFQGVRRDAGFGESGTGLMGVRGGMLGVG